MNPSTKKTTFVEGGPSSEEFFELKQKVTGNELELEDIKQQLAALQEKTKVLSEYDNKLETMNKRLDDANLQEIRDKINEVNADNKAIKNKIKSGNLTDTTPTMSASPSFEFSADQQKLNDEINELKKQVKELQNTLKDMKYKPTIKDIQENIDDFNKFIDAMKAKVNSIEDKLPETESSSASGSEDEDQVKQTEELLMEIPKLKDQINYHSISIGTTAKNIQNLRDVVKTLTDQVNKHNFTFEVYGRSINNLKRSLNKLASGAPIATKSTDVKEEDQSASGSDTEEQNDIISNDDNTLSDNALIELETLKKEFAQFKENNKDTLGCLKHEVKKIIHSLQSSLSASPSKKKNKHHQNQQDDIFNPENTLNSADHRLLSKISKEIKCIKYELKKLLLMADTGKLATAGNFIEIELQEESASCSDSENEIELHFINNEDSKDNNKQDQIKTKQVRFGNEEQDQVQVPVSDSDQNEKEEEKEDPLEVLKRVLKWNFVDVSPEVYVDKETKHHIVPSPVLPIISTLFEEEFFNPSNVDSATFDRAMNILEKEFPHIKMTNPNSRFICTYLVMNLVNLNSSKSKFDKERVDTFNKTFAPIMNIAATMIVLPLLQKFEVFINRFATGSFEIGPLKKDFNNILDSSIEEFQLNYNPTINSYLQKVLFALLDKKTANGLLSNPSRFDYISVNNWSEFIDSFEVDLPITKQIVTCLNKSYEIANNDDLRKQLCPDLETALVVFLLKNYIPDQKANQQIDIKAVEERLGVNAADTYGPITSIELPQVQMNTDLNYEIYKEITKGGIQKDLLQEFPYLSKYIDNNSQNEN
ncbi:hypothetical protein M9Y10_037867 [Tritrichomonas musculus]|uniref:Dilute domain-containing protein n=1 Tax=Tritrichomonas musculus TaxID=1915356 RepID=A0ABR2K701_9EUKA